MNTVLALHGSVYAHSSTEYGPALFAAWTLIFSLLRLPVTHDVGRLITLVFWGLGAGLGSLFVLKLTRSLTMGLAALLLSLVALSTLTNEPLQPAALIEPGLVVLLLLLASNRLTDQKLIVIGILLMSIALCKINLGGYAVLGIVAYDLLLRSRYSAKARGFALLALLVPVLLMAPLVRETWVEMLGASVAVVAFAVVTFGHAQMRATTPNPLRWAPIALGMMGAGIVEVGAALLRGETVSQIVRATLLVPLGQVNLDVPIPNGPWVLLATCLILATALICRQVAAVGRSRSTRVGQLSSWESHEPGGRESLPGDNLVRVALSGLVVTRVAAGLLAVLPALTGSSLAGLSCAALVLFPTLGRTDVGQVRGRFALATLTTTLACQTYPTAGSQLGFASFFVVVCAVVVLYDAGIDLFAIFGAIAEPGHKKEWHSLAAPAFGISGRTKQWATRAAGLALLAVVVLVTVPSANVAAEWQQYTARSPLPLPGSAMMRLAPEDATALVATTRYLDRECQSLVTMPSMASFYLWSNLKPPSGFILPDGALWLERTYQASVAHVIATDTGLCVVRSTVVDTVYHQGSPLRYAGPLISVLHRDFTLIKTIGIYRIYHHVAIGSSTIQ